jgi:hypothetical protein
MTRPSAYPGFLGNYNGDVPTIALRMIVAQEINVRPAQKARPALTAYRGYDGEGRRYYFAEGGRWLDTLTLKPWGGK